MEDTHLRLLRLIEARPGLSQRDLARELGTSLGKVMVGWKRGLTLSLRERVVVDILSGAPEPFRGL